MNNFKRLIRFICFGLMLDGIVRLFLFSQSQRLTEMIDLNYLLSFIFCIFALAQGAGGSIQAVSYTHLTLPTTPYV